MLAGMSSSKPPAAPPPPPPPVSATGADTAQASADQKRRERKRYTYDKTLLSPLGGGSPDGTGMKTTLGG